MPAEPTENDLLPNHERLKLPPGEVNRGLRVHKRNAPMAAAGICSRRGDISNDHDPLADKSASGFQDAIWCTPPGCMNAELAGRWLVVATQRLRSQRCVTAMESEISVIADT